MQSEKDTKAMAKALREELARRGVAVTHGECLDIVARQFGFADCTSMRPSEAPIHGSMP